MCIWSHILVKKWALVEFFFLIVKVIFYIRPLMETILIPKFATTFFLLDNFSVCIIYIPLRLNFTYQLCIYQQGKNKKEGST